MHACYKLDYTELMLNRTIFMRRYQENARYLIGIDEAGRGPLAGPLVVAGVFSATGGGDGSGGTG